MIVTTRMFGLVLLASSVAGFAPRGSGDSWSSLQAALDHDAMDRRSALLGTVGIATSALFQPPQEASAAASPSQIQTIPTWTLENGVSFPTLALNTVGLSTEETERAVRLAVQQGINHIDFHPGKERDGVAAYMRRYGREGLFLNTKIRKAPPGTSAQDAAERTRTQIEEDFRALGVTQVDMLMLRDSPDCDVIQAQWAVLEDALASGKTKSLGVINFCEKALTCLLETAKEKPAINYYMLHVGMGPNAHGLRNFCDTNGIRTFAYGAVGEPGPNSELLQSPELVKIGKAHKKNPEDVALRWVLQSGAAVSVRPTTEFGLGVSACRDDSSCATGLRARGSAFDWKLSANEMKRLDSMKSPDDNPTLFSSAGCPGAFVMPK